MIPLQTGKMPAQAAAFVDGSRKLVQDAFYLLNTLFNRTGGQSGIPITIATGLAATGASQDAALALSDDWNEVATTPAGSGVQLAAMQPGQSQLVFNGGANALKVYPQSGDIINALGADAPFSLAAGKTQIFRVSTQTQIRTVSLG